MSCAPCPARPRKLPALDFVKQELPLKRTSYLRARGPFPWGWLLTGLFLAGIVIAVSPALAQETATEPAQPATPDPNQVIAEINGQKVTRQQVIDSAADLPPQVRQQIDLIFPQLVERYIGLTLIGAEGRKQNLAEDPEVKAEVAEAEELAIRQIYVRRVLREKVNDQTIQARYDAKIKELANVEEVKAAHVLVASEEEAKAIAEELAKGADFATVAKEKSTDKGSGANGGDLGWFTKEVMVKEFADAAFAMKPGEISAQPVKSQFGWHVIKLIERRTRQPPSLEEMRPGIETELSEEAIQQVVGDLRKAAQVQVMAPPPATP